MSNFHRSILMPLVPLVTFLASEVMAQPTIATPGMASPQASRLPQSPVEPPISVEELEQEFGAVPLVQLPIGIRPLQVVLDDIGRQVGTNLKADPEIAARDTPMNLKVPTPFWDVLLHLMHTTNVSVLRRQVDFEVSDKGSEWLEGVPKSSVGSFLTFATMVYRNKQLPLRQSPVMTKNLDSASLQLQFFGYPHGRLAGQQSVRVEEIVDDQDEKYTLPTRVMQSSLPGMMYSPGTIYSVGGYRAELGRISSQAKSLKSIKGFILTTMSFGTDTWEINDIFETKDLVHHVDGTTLTFRGIETDPNWHRIRVTVAMLSANRSIFDDASRNFQMLDANGKSLGPGRTTQRYNADSAEMTIEFPSTTRGEQVGPPVKILWNIPVKIRRIKVPFEFKDIPLP
jgi:hypothetical protein